MTAKMLSFASAVALIAGLTMPAIAQTTTTNTNTNTTTNPKTTNQTQCTNTTTTSTSGTAGTTSSGTSSTSSSTTPSSNAPASPNTATTNSANTNTNCMTPGTTQPMNANPPPGTMNPPSNAGMEMNALTNNPNGSNWLDKFNRPVARTAPSGSMTPMMGTTRYAAGRHHKSRHRVKRASGGGGH